MKGGLERRPWEQEEKKVSMIYISSYPFLSQIVVLKTRLRYPRRQWFEALFASEPCALNFLPCAPVSCKPCPNSGNGFRKILDKWSVCHLKKECWYMYITSLAPVHTRDTRRSARGGVSDAEASAGRWQGRRSPRPHGVHEGLETSFSIHSVSFSPRVISC